MKMIFKPAVVLSAILLVANSCSNSTDSEKSTEEPHKTEAKADTEKIEEENNLVKKPDTWIQDRVAKAKELLNSTEGGKIVWAGMDAHGGLDNWLSYGTVSFRFDYMPIAKGVARKTISQVDVWSNRVVQQDIEDSEDTFGCDGQKAWSFRNDTLQFAYDVKFWALTPYYFLGQPFIFDGQGVQIEKLADETLNGITYDAVKITFEAGTGDAPDDYYINLYDKETHLLKALKYIVSYPARFKNGGHSPEKTMILGDLVETDGILLPSSYETFALSEVEGQLGEKVTLVEVSQVSFLPQLENNHFEMPEKAVEVTE
jgi:hypothetical protein